MRPGGFGEVWDATDEHGQTASPAERRRQEHEWGIAAEQALRSAKACGREPAGIERPLSESRQSQQDWRAILRDFVAAPTPCDYRWAPPNRRHIASGLYLPSVERRGMGEIVIAVDTSGSIGKREPVCFIYLTDLCCHSYPEAPEYPVLWVTDSRRTAPFGETLRISLE
jgi:predicted metal-dependent peptidase